MQTLLTLRPLLLHRRHRGHRVLRRVRRVAAAAVAAAVRRRTAAAYCRRHLRAGRRAHHAAGEHLACRRWPARRSGSIDGAALLIEASILLLLQLLLYFVNFLREQMIITLLVGRTFEHIFFDFSKTILYAQKNVCASCKKRAAHTQQILRTLHS